MRVISSDEIRHYEICTEGADVMSSDGQLLIRISADDIQRLARILTQKQDIADKEERIRKIADGSEDVPGF